MIDINGSLMTLARNEHDRGHGPLKLPEDLDRYEKIIEESAPTLIIETGTLNGESARWFNAVADCRIITIDVEQAEMPGAPWLKRITGDSVSERVIRRVAWLAERYSRVMVSLDSDHSAPHVAQEIQLYGPLVTPGCYLVVEDGIFHYADEGLRVQHGLGDMRGDPLMAIMGSVLPHSRRWARNRLVEDMHPVTHHPAGWWRRV